MVYSDGQKLRLLQKKINADFLSNTKDYINGEMNKSHMMVAVMADVDKEDSITTAGTNGDTMMPEG